jgi:hypothetical protein
MKFALKTHIMDQSKQSILCGIFAKNSSLDTEFPLSFQLGKFDVSRLVFFANTPHDCDISVQNSLA